MKKCQAIIYAFLVATLLLAFSGNIAKGDTPLYEQVAFDRIRLLESEGGGVFDVFPIPFPNGRRPVTLPKTGELTVRFVELPGDEYTIHWSAIESVEVFDDLVLKELRERQAELLQRISALPAQPVSEPPPHPLKESLENVYGYYDYLFKKPFQYPGVMESYRQYLIGEANYYYKCRDWPNAVARLERMAKENKNYPRLAEMWGRVFEDMLKDLTAREQFRQARSMMRLLETHYPNHTTAKKWRNEYLRRAKSQLASARRAIGEKRFSVAHRHLDEAQRIYPKLPELKTQAEELHRLYPSVRIGVSRSAHDFLRISAERDFDSCDKTVLASVLPEAIRVQRLVDRSFLEPVGFDIDGGIFESAFGEIQRQNGGRVIRFQVASPNSQRLFSPVSVGESLLATLDPRRNRSSSLWVGAFDHLAFEPQEQMMIVRTQPHVLPESFFRIPLSLSERNPFSETEIPEEEIALLNAPYRLIRNTENPNGENGLLASFRYNESYVLPFGTGAKLIHEQTITDTSEGIQQLAARKIAAIDRLAPWEISSSLKVSKDFQIGQYAHPTVHFLVPNRNKPLPASRTFRRALLYGLNREAILKELAPQHAGDVQLLSGAMPRGVAGTAPIGYGYDLSVSPRIYDAKLAVALALMSITNARDKGLLKEEERPKVPRKAQIASDMPELVLAYPENTASELAARLIWRYWEMIGIPVRIIPYSQAEPIGRGTKVDFWYVPCQVTEPMFDAHAILSKDGLAGASSVYMELALEKLRQAQTWPEISTALQEIHRLTHEETSVLPLWQWRDCFIVHRELTGVLQRDALPSRDDSIARNELIHFYQNVEHWNVPFHWNELEK